MLDEQNLNEVEGVMLISLSDFIPLVGAYHIKRLQHFEHILLVQWYNFLLALCFE